MNMLILAFFAGIITVTSPCIIPLVPIILGSALKQDKRYPLIVVVGMATAFTFFGLLFGIFSDLLPFDRRILHTIAYWLLAFMGVILLIPPLETKISALTSQLFAKLSQKTPQVNALHQPSEAFFLGALLGLVWAPCAGPVLGSIIILSSTAENAPFAGILFLLYAIGAGLPMLLIAYGGQKVLKRKEIFQKYNPLLKKAFGILLIITAFFLATGTFKRMEKFLTPYAPVWSTQF